MVSNRRPTDKANMHEHLAYSYENIVVYLLTYEHLAQSYENLVVSYLKFSFTLSTIL